MKSVYKSASEIEVGIPRKTTDMSLRPMSFIEMVHSPKEGMVRRVKVFTADHACSKNCTTKSPLAVLRVTSTQRPLKGEAASGFLA